MSTKNDPLIGKQLGAYQVQSSLGEGGMARVYKAYHPRLRRDVAIKVIRVEIADREGFQARFEREAQVIASLEHPNIVSVYDFGEEGDLTYLVMQYVGGGTLRAQLRGKQPLQPQHAVHYAIQMARALHHAHQRGIVHRDVKPQNMLVSSADPAHLLLSDFGIAKLYAQSTEGAIIEEMPTRDPADPSLTSIDQIVGTADYMSPEQAHGQQVDARTDVYALGVVLYQMLTGDVPFHSTTLQGLLFQHIYTPPPPIRAKNPHVPEILAWITAKALAKAPADRFQSAEALARALEQANNNATNLPGAFLPGSSDALAAPRATSSGPATPYTTGNQTPPVIHSPRQTDSYATVPASQTPPGSERITPPTGAAAPISGVQKSRQRKRVLPLSYVLAALALIVCLVVFGIRLLPGLSGNPGSSNGATSNTSTAQAFNEHFQDTRLSWLAGNIAPGVSASTPGGGAYSVTISQNTTAFPYPQAVGALPANFTLAATLQQSSGARTSVYGLAFHLSGDTGNVSCYALVVDSSGGYEILEYTNSRYTTISQGSYQPAAQKHTLEVKAQGNSYTFLIDGQIEQIQIGANPPGNTWNNSDLHGGRLALLFAGPASGGASTKFVATNVQLSIP